MNVLEKYVDERLLFYGQVFGIAFTGRKYQHMYEAVDPERGQVFVDFVVVKDGEEYGYHFERSRFEQAHKEWIKEGLIDLGTGTISADEVVLEVIDEDKVQAKRAVNIHNITEPNAALLGLCEDLFFELLKASPKVATKYKERVEEFGILHKAEPTNNPCVDCEWGNGEGGCTVPDPCPQKDGEEA